MKIKQSIFLTPFLYQFISGFNEDEKHVFLYMDSAQKSQFLSLYCMVLADGVIDARELEMLYGIGVKQYGLSQTDIVECVRNVGSSFLLPETLEGKIRFLVNMAQIAFADGQIDNAERSLLEKYIRKMNFEEENVNGIADFLLESVVQGKEVEEIVNIAIGK